MRQFGQQVGDGRDRREIGDPARGEDERGFLAVQIGEFALELDDGVAACRKYCACRRRRRRPCSRVSTMAAITSGCWPMPR